MKVSVIVPVYNAEKYLVKCLKSLVEQTLDDYEVILINDGSKDSSEEILKAYAAEYPEKVRFLTVENGGQGRARNIGIDMAKGEYIGFADSDDWVELTMFEKLYNAAAESGADMVQCDIYECYEDGRNVYCELTAPEHPMNTSTVVWNKLYKRALISDIKFPEGLWYEDLAYVIEAVLGAKTTVEVKEALYFYRIGQISTMTNNNSKRNLEIIKILELLKEKMLPQRREDFEILVARHVLLDAINRVSTHKNEDKNKVIREMADYCRQNIPNLTASPAFRMESKNRQLIMLLNYYGAEKISRLILNAKKLVK